jgi:hypothetical protein
MLTVLPTKASKMHSFFVENRSRIGRVAKNLQPLGGMDLPAAIRLER